MGIVLPLGVAGMIGISLEIAQKNRPGYQPGPVTDEIHHPSYTLPRV